MSETASPAYDISLTAVAPGRWTTVAQPEWRNHFRGTAAHNTARIDGLDQSVIGGNFMWMHKANAFCEQWHSTSQEDCLVAHHDGYLRLSDPVLHRRRLVLQKARRQILVEDTFECRGAHVVELGWHFSEQCRVHLCGNGAIVNRDSVRLHIGMSHAEAGPVLVRGQASPPLGWVSHRFDEKTASPTLVWNKTIAGTQTFITRLAIFLRQ